MSTTLPTMPPVVTEVQVRRACAGSLADTSVCVRVKEQRVAWQAFERERDAEGARLRADREAKQAAEAKARADAREAERAAAMDALKTQARASFFAANREAGEDDFERLWPRLRDDELVRRTAEARDADRDAALRSGDYGAM